MALTSPLETRRDARVLRAGSVSLARVFTLLSDEMAAAAEEAVVVVDIGGRTTKKKTDDDDDDDVEGAGDGEAEDLLELCEEDVWGTMDGDEEERDDLDAERASVSSDDEDEDDDEGCAARASPERASIRFPPPLSRRLRHPLRRRAGSFERYPATPLATVYISPSVARPPGFLFRARFSRRASSSPPPVGPRCASCEYSSDRFFFVHFRSHHDVSRRRDHFAMELTPRVPSATYGSLPAWRHSSLPRAIVRPPGRAADAETAGKRGSPSPSDARTAKAARAGGGIATLLASSLPDDDDAMFIPPHVYASTYGARGTGSVSERAFWGDAASGMDQLLLGGSVVSGRGHTLKGRDALKMRTAILRQTGFVEPTMTALDAMNGGAGSFEGERVPRVPTPAIAPRMGGGTTSPTT